MAAVIDSQSVKVAATVPRATSGYDAGKIVDLKRLAFKGHVHCRGHFHAIAGRSLQQAGQAVHGALVHRSGPGREQQRATDHLDPMRRVLSARQNVLDRPRPCPLRNLHRHPFTAHTQPTLLNHSEERPHVTSLPVGSGGTRGGGHARCLS